MGWREGREEVEVLFFEIRKMTEKRRGNSRFLLLLIVSRNVSKNTSITISIKVSILISILVFLLISILISILTIILTIIPFFFVIFPYFFRTFSIERNAREAVWRERRKGL